MNIKDMRLLKRLLLQYKRDSIGWVRHDINMVLEKLNEDIKSKKENDKYDSRDN